MGLDTGEDEDAVDCSSKKPSVLRRLCRAARPDWIVIPFGLLAVLLASSAAPMQEGKSVDAREFGDARDCKMETSLEADGLFSVFIKLSG